MISLGLICDSLGVCLLKSALLTRAMLLITSLTVFLILIVSSVTANPIVVRKSPVSLSIARHFNITGSHDLVKKDQVRAKNILLFGKAKRISTFSDDPGASVGMTNNLKATYYVSSIGVGTPPTSCRCRCFISGLDSEPSL